MLDHLLLGVLIQLGLPIGVSGRMRLRPVVAHGRILQDYRLVKRVIHFSICAYI
jgi:hypothetical protein